jgi:hypothetical protein
VTYIIILLVPIPVFLLVGFLVFFCSWHCGHQTANPDGLKCPWDNFDFSFRILWDKFLFCFVLFLFPLHFFFKVRKGSCWLSVGCTKGYSQLVAGPFGAYRARAA